MSDAGAGGPRGAHSELVACLRQAMTDRKMKQSQLAKAAGVSAATVSNILNERSVPTVDSLGLLAGALGFTEARLRELHSLRDQADVRKHRLGAYLAAARRAAREHPYPGVLPGASPPLATVYLRQQATRQRRHESQFNGDTAGPLDIRAGSQAADEILAGGQTCVVVAGPGGGKTSLLRTRLADCVEQWLNGRGEDVVPVLVPAAALAGRPLTQALAAAATADLASHGLVDELTPAFFATPPQPGVRWLLLVDGLDEMTDPAARHEVLRALAAVAGGEHGGLYRFVVATRPLPDGELDVLGLGVPRYDLQPFSPDDLRPVAIGWFRAIGLADPDSAAERFVDAMRRTRLADLARIPLMASMLCQLHAAAPGRPLPAGRGQIYRDFIRLLHRQQYTPAHARLRVQDRAGVDRYGSAARAQAERTLDHLQDLIALLAAERHRGNTLSAITLLEARPEAQRPPRVPQDEWHAFLITSLCRSGLLTVRAGEIVFLHQTLMEHLAARHATRDHGSRTRTLHQIFHRPRGYGWLNLAPGGPRRQWPHRYWDPPLEHSSYVGFLLDAAQEGDPCAATSHLARLVPPHGGLSGCRFIAAQARLGTLLPEEVVDAAADVFAGLARDSTLDGSYRLKSAGTLAELRPSRAADVYAGLADDTALDGSTRMVAARALAKLEAPRAAGVYAGLARDSTFDGYYRMAAARAVAGLEAARAADVYAALADDTTLDGYDRMESVETLAGLGDGRTAELLSRLADDTTLHDHFRVRAAGNLAERHDDDAAELLSRLARDSTLGGYYRLRSAEALAGLRTSLAADMYAGLADDTALDSGTRLKAARELAELGGHRAEGTGLLRALADDTTLTGISRVHAARSLAQLDGHRAEGTALLAHLADDTALNSIGRLKAARELAELGGHRAEGTGLLRALADDTTLTGISRVHAARSLAELDGHRAEGTALLAHLADDTALNGIGPHGSTRMRAVRALAELDAARAADVYAGLVDDATLDGYDRLEAAETLAGLGDRRTAELLAGLANDTTLDGPYRLKAARGLAELDGHRAEGAGLLGVLADDTALTDVSRAHAARSLAELDGHRTEGVVLPAGRP
ncbi:transcriptional regulator with XRE-family HTH domain [Kitasatospora herbaricolor]|uniref:helix-turn-helix domain-containing protein n=1 Tax=Kitasatospora herbaricolor TaxID=68217 RepID=UPI002792F1AB|nr:helix-turn-helix domain-containing protein [Kitasatospora herbaricolor]MDQ0310236.1 transcriptional regulator with XRE-family HTH domain [Kitasatospora herbaricolor]